MTDPKAYLTPKRQLGQNFLVDKNAAERLIAACELKKEDTVLEIGPGLGALTQLIAPQVKSIIAIETDRRYAHELERKFAGANVSVIQADFLKFDLGSLPYNLKLIGNLPYYISTPIIESILEHRKHFSDIYVTVQLEFGQRLAAKPNTKAYGSLSCFVQYYLEPKILSRIKNTSFKPPPKVDSCFLRLGVRPEPLYKAHDEAFLFQMIRTAFQQRRKTIGNGLSVFMNKELLGPIFQKAGVDPKARAEDLSLKDFVKLSNSWKVLDPVQPK